MALSLVRILVMARLLSVEQFAALNLGLIVSGLIAMLNAGGLFQELQRRLPVQLELRRRREAIIQIILTAIGSFVVASIVMLVAIGSSSFFDFAWPIALVGVWHGFSQQLFLISATESRSNGEPMRYARQNLTRSVIVILLTIPTAIYFGTANTVLLVESAVALLASAVIFKSTLRRLSTNVKVALPLALRSVRSLRWASLAALVLMSVTIAASINLDRWLAVNVLSEQHFAQYAFASVSFTTALAIQALINASIYPAIAKRLAISGKAAAFRLAFKTSLSCLILCAVFAAPTVFIAKLLIRAYFPQYSDAISLLIPFALAGAFRLSDFWSSLLVVSGRERSVLSINLMCLVAGVGVFYFLSGIKTANAESIAYLAAGTAATGFLLSWWRCWSASSTV